MPRAPAIGTIHPLITASRRAGVLAALAGHRGKAINRIAKGVACRASQLDRGNPMKTVLTVLGVVLLVIAAIYFLVPADQLPGFFPGHEAGVTRVHMKHGVVAGVAGLILLGAGVWMGRR